MAATTLGWFGALGAALKRLPPPQNAGPARLASMAPTPQASVHVVQWQGEELLLGCTAQGVSLLARRPAPPAEGGTS